MAQALRKLADLAEAGELDGLPGYLARALVATLEAILAWAEQDEVCV